jgi:hypothetical protein
MTTPLLHRLQFAFLMTTLKEEVRLVESGQVTPLQFRFLTILARKLDIYLKIECKIAPVSWGMYFIYRDSVGMTPYQVSSTPWPFSWLPFSTHYHTIIIGINNQITII